MAIYILPKRFSTYRATVPAPSYSQRFLPEYLHKIFANTVVYPQMQILGGKCQSISNTPNAPNKFISVPRHEIPNSRALGRTAFSYRHQQIQNPKEIGNYCYTCTKDRTSSMFDAPPSDLPVRLPFGMVRYRRIHTGSEIKSIT